MTDYDNIVSMDQVSELPSKRASAKALGSKLYYTGKPCKRGHIAPRYTTGACTTCSIEIRKDWREKNVAPKQRSAPKPKDYWRSNFPDKYREIQKASHRKARFVKPFSPVINGMKWRSKKLGLQFDLTHEFLMDLYNENPNCPITLKRMLLSWETGDLRERASIDRKDPKGGYTKQNVRMISYAANTMKSDHTDPEIFERMATYIREQC
jgi:hypothetical protein